MNLNTSNYKGIDPSIDDQGQTEVQPEQILKFRWMQKGLWTVEEALVRWKGPDSEEAILGKE